MCTTSPMLRMLRDTDKVRMELATLVQIGTAFREMGDAANCTLLSVSSRPLDHCLQSLQSSQPCTTQGALLPPNARCLFFEHTYHNWALWWVFRNAHSSFGALEPWPLFSVHRNCPETGKGASQRPDAYIVHGRAAPSPCPAAFRELA